MNDTTRPTNADDSVSFDVELEAITKRREFYDLPAPGNKQPVCGLALSGGGIRSATFGLGVLRGLSAAGVLHQIDYLSTVSGGGYIGSFFCGLFAGRGTVPPVIAKPVADKDLLAQPEALRSIGYLRQAGRFLAPGGGRDLIYALALLSRNWLALTVVVGVAIVFAEVAIDGLRHIVAANLPIWLSPFLVVLAATTLLTLASGWAYWLTLRRYDWSDGSARKLSPPLIGTLFIIASAGGIALFYPNFVKSLRALPVLVQFSSALVLSVAVLALVLNAFAIWLERDDKSVFFAFRGLVRKIEFADIQALAKRDDRVRNRLSAWQGWFALAMLAFLGLSLADSTSFFLFWIASTKPIVRLSALVYPVLAPVAQWLLKRIDASAKTADAARQGGTGVWLARLAGPLTALGALSFAALAMAIWGLVAHELVMGLPSAANFPQTWSIIWDQSASWKLAALTIFVALASLTSGFINFSSLASFYSDRLRSAYLGASNRRRIGSGPQRGLSVYTADAGDDLSLSHYYEDAVKNGAPVHIINVTINETRGKGPQTVQQDRHGINMAISPQGMIYNEAPGNPPTTKPLLGSNGQPSGQSLPLSAWIGISGAAFSTGLGQGTSTTRAFLAFLANVRLGYWWRADRYRASTAPTYVNIARELFASFPGTDAREWYLSDGGHFENTAVYELIRREVPVIIVSDNGCDPHYVYDDLANLVRKARIDFRAEITFPCSALLDARFAGDADLRRLFAHPRDFNKGAADTALAMLADIAFASGKRGTMVVIKPKLNQWRPEDIASYAAAHSDFPQQTTLNQFFSEDQWESYEKLGMLVSEMLFKARSSAGSWYPAQLQPFL